jgi:hypothetical protein
MNWYALWDMGCVMRMLPVKANLNPAKSPLLQCVSIQRTVGRIQCASTMREARWFHLPIY